MVCWAHTLANVLYRPNFLGHLVGSASRILWPCHSETFGRVAHRFTRSRPTRLGPGEGAKAARVAIVARIAQGFSEHDACRHHPCHHSDRYHGEQDDTSHCQPAFFRFPNGYCTQHCPMLAILRTPGDYQLLRDTPWLFGVGAVLLTGEPASGFSVRRLGRAAISAPYWRSSSW